MACTKSGCVLVMIAGNFFRKYGTVHGPSEYRIAVKIGRNRLINPFNGDMDFSVFTWLPLKREKATGNTAASSTPSIGAQGYVLIKLTRCPVSFKVLIQLFVVGLRPSATMRICMN